MYNVRVRALLLMNQIKAKEKILKPFDFKPDVEKKLFTPFNDISHDFLMKLQNLQEKYFMTV